MRRYGAPLPHLEAQKEKMDGKLRWDTARERKETWLYDNGIGQWPVRASGRAAREFMAAMPPARLASPRPAPHSPPRQIRPDLLKNIVTRKDPS